MFLEKVIEGFHFYEQWNSVRGVAFEIMDPKLTFGCLFTELMQKSGWGSFAKDFSLENLKSFAAQRLFPQASKFFLFY